jgi:hypothetical protein
MFTALSDLKTHVDALTGPPVFNTLTGWSVRIQSSFCPSSGGLEDGGSVWLTHFKRDHTRVGNNLLERDCEIVNVLQLTDLHFIPINTQYQEFLKVIWILVAMAI